MAKPPTAETSPAGTFSASCQVAEDHNFLSTDLSRAGALASFAVIWNLLPSPKVPMWYGPGRLVTVSSNAGVLAGLLADTSATHAGMLRVRSERGEVIPEHGRLRPSPEERVGCFVTKAISQIGLIYKRCSPVWSHCEECWHASLVAGDGGQRFAQTFGDCMKQADERRENLLARVGKRVGRSGVGTRYKRMFRNPFQDGQQHVLMHTAHHKVGTSWFSAIYRALASEFGMPFVLNDPNRIRPGTSTLFFQNRVKIAPEKLNPYRGSHMIRDPRDVIVSGYHYHLWTREAWANTRIADLPEEAFRAWRLLPLDKIQDMTYVQYLNTLSQEEGLIAEIHRVLMEFDEVFDWNYADERIFNFRYEDIMRDEVGVLRKLFTHYGFRPEMVERSVEIAGQFSFSRRTGRAKGDVAEQSHIRSGKLQQWKSAFTPVVTQRFKELFGEKLIRLGYEQDLNW
ncbi:MAG: sulfotransferase domain-containing protein [Pseudomonadales bacterium]|nr:sulfotransferase domain-containing protein [Pseudomonadales bacterium]